MHLPTKTVADLLRQPFVNEYFKNEYQNSIVITCGSKCLQFLINSNISNQSRYFKAFVKEQLFNEEENENNEKEKEDTMIFLKR